MVTKEKLLENLKKDGWNEDRCIDIRVFDEVVKENGFCWFEAAEKFLKSYGMLSLKYYSARADSINQIIVNPYIVMPDIGKNHLYLYEKKCGMKLFVVAEEYVGIYIAEDGSLWSGYDDCFAYLGDDLIDFFFREGNNIEMKRFILRKNF